ncbi:MAG: FtsX-like permease family protein [Balneolaceae bacterium]
MLRNYLLVALRNVRKHKFEAFINVLSLSIGISSCIVIFLFISHERSFDSMHRNSENIYRLCEKQSVPGMNTQIVPLSMPGMGPSLVSDFPEIRNFTRYYGKDNQVWKSGDKKLIVEFGAFVDSTFLEIFDFKFIAGNQATALDNPRSIVITTNTANRFFGNENVIGRTLEMDNTVYRVTGLIENNPKTSHLQFDLLISFSTLTQKKPSINTEFRSNWLITYLELGPDANLNEMSKRYPDYLVRNTGSERINEFYKLLLQPLSEVHLLSTEIEFDHHNYRKFNGTYLQVFALIGIVILIIAAINFMNLSTARARNRIKEIGIRKSFGVSRNQLFTQFITESIALAFISLILSFTIVIVSSPLLNSVLDRSFSFLALLYDIRALIVLFTSTLGIGFLAGLYPALLLSSLSSAKILNAGDGFERKSNFRSIITVIQIGSALVLIVGTLVIIQQMRFIKNKDIGITKDHILLVDMNSTANEKRVILKQELLKSRHVLSVTASSQRIGNNFNQWGFKAELDTGILEMAPSNILVDSDYLDVYEIDLLEGRTFSNDISSDDGLAFIVNESFVREVGYSDPIGKRVGHSWYPNDSLGTIIGVVKDFNFNSLHFSINPLAMVVHSTWDYDELSIKLDGLNVRHGLNDVKSIWDKYVPDYPMDYSFLNDHFDEIYKNDHQLSSIISIITILSILIACLGLLGQSAITVHARLKEVAIRKVLGANQIQLFYELSKQILLLILISLIVASPVTYYYLVLWLDNFAFRITINPLTFIFGGLLATTIAIGTISYNVIKAVTTNPIKSLNSE